MVLNSTNTSLEENTRKKNYLREISLLIRAPSDSWCQNPENVVRPKLCMEPHSAPLDVMFWDNENWPGIKYADAFVALHGSWNRDPPGGYRVDHVIYKDGDPVDNVPFLGYQGPGAYKSGLVVWYTLFMLY